MRKLKIILVFLLLHNITVAQEAMHNFGNLKIHANTLVGLHLDFINNGVTNDNLGLIGFYNTNNSLSISGANTPVFYDMEVMVDDHLYLETPVEITNNGSFISGNITTPRNNPNIHLNFLNNAFYVGQTSTTKVDGYAALTNKDTFVFPIGTYNRIRTLTLDSGATNAFAKCAYFFEDPNNTSTFSQNFDTEEKQTNLFNVSTTEYWHLESDIPSKVTLTWDSFSGINSMVEMLTDLKVVGWSKSLQKWVNLGNSQVQGDFSNGTLTSNDFLPNEYDILTFGYNSTETIGQLGNYMLTPNGDGINDFLVIDGIDGFENNTLKIYNRYGRIVFSKEDYTNEFNGFSDNNATLKQNKGLPSGVYFYIVTITELNEKQQGYIYISADDEN